MLTFISSIPVVVPQLTWNAYSPTSSTLFTDFFVLPSVGLLKSAFLLLLLQNEPFVVVISRCWSGRTTAISSVTTLTSTSQTGLASRTFAAADGNTPWLSSKKFTRSFSRKIERISYTSSISGTRLLYLLCCRIIEHFQFRHSLPLLFKMFKIDFIGFQFLSSSPIVVSTP